MDGDQANERPPWAARWAAVSYVVDVGFAAAMPIALAHLARRGELPMTPWGFRAFAGPFESLGTTPFNILGSTLMLVSACDVVAGIWLWQGHRRGADLGLGLTPLTIALGAGFALPLYLLPIPVRTALLFRARSRLR